MTRVAVDCFNRFNGLDALIAVDGFVATGLEVVDQRLVNMRVIRTRALVLAV